MRSTRFLSLLIIAALVTALFVGCASNEGSDETASPGANAAAAAEERQVDAVLTGGSGRASVQSPAKLFAKDGADYAQIIWNSPNYTYMLVDGVEYLPVNTEGNSTFEIPVVLDADMPVIACTVAMSSPKEIEYTLHFAASSIK